MDMRIETPTTISRCFHSVLQPEAGFQEVCKCAVSKQSSDSVFDVENIVLDNVKYKEMYF